MGIHFQHLRVRKGFAIAKSITKKYAKTFYLASLFLPRRRRLAAYAVYAICRANDGTVNDIRCNAHTERLLRLKECIVRVYSQAALNDPLLLCVRKTVQDYEIPQKYFDELIAGMYVGLCKSRFKDFDELYDYCYKVAGVAALIMLKILDPQNTRIQEYAVRLGVAMQLTTILRDIKEDFQRARVYLPQEEFLHHRTSELAIAKESVTYGFTSLLQFQIARARTYYSDASPGIKMLKGIRSRFTVYVMKAWYEGILTAIERRRYDVFSKRACVPCNMKLRIIFGTLLRGQYL